MTSWWVVLVLALAGTAVGVGLLLPALRRFGVVDQAGDRSSHSGVVPRGGGIACLAVASALTLGALVGPGGVAQPSDLAAAVGFAASMSVLGTIDDVRSLGAVPRLAVQVCAAALFAFLVGPTAGMAVVLAGAVLLPALINAINFIDGINGLAATLAAVSGVWLATAVPGAGESAVGFVGVLTAGVALGFLPWNVPIARVFLGDSGSYLLGSLVGACAFLALLSGASVTTVLAPVIIPIADVFGTLLRRVAHRRPLLSAHRDHVYQQLVHRVGLSHTTVTAVVGLLALGCCALDALLGPAATALSYAVVTAAYLVSARTGASLLRVRTTT